MSSTAAFIQLNSEQTSLIIDCTDNQPKIIYWGAKISQLSTIDELQLLSFRQEAKCAPVIEPLLSLTPTLGDGFTGSPGLELRSATHAAWMFSGKISQISQSDDQCTICLVDSIRKIELTYNIRLDQQTNVLSASTSIKNLADSTINIDWLASLTLPINSHLNTIHSFEGRWANEFRRSKVDRFLGSYVKENRKGKTSHDNFPGVVISDPATNEAQGECIGIHLGWSGNHRTRVESLTEGRGFAQMGELLHPGEVALNANDIYTTPTIYASYSNQGLTALSNNFHRYVRNHLLTYKATDKLRPIHYNTWEAIYFDHTDETLIELAKKAAQLGVERFVLDDGWFKGRRDDKAGLGDWVVDTKIYPEGLNNIINTVNDLGMEFGIWFEPEMVNPNSDLYRAHPDWILQAEGTEQIQFRNQYVLDLTRTEVVEYLYQAISDILNAHPQIKYIKWDMNRDINHPNNHLGLPAVHRQTHALYELIDKLKQTFPTVEIESCSSGGARVDYGILKHTDRVWTSDSNDALDRLSIQRGCSFFFPAEVMGAHVGPRDCHITGRHIDIEMRAAVSIFGHMGMEMDPRELTEHEADVLSSAFALHKANRHLIHGGDLVRLDSEEYAINFGLVAPDKSEALYAYNLVKEQKNALPPKYLFTGLDPNQSYRLDKVWPIKLSQYSKSVLDLVDGKTFKGELLINLGMQLPIMLPESSLIFKLTAV